MPFIPVPNVIACDVIASLFGQIIENTLYFANTEAVIPSEVSQMAASVGEWAVNRLCGVLSEDYTYLRTEATDITTEGLASITDVAGTGTTGGVASESAPGGTCLAVSFRTGLGGRSYRGRNYVSGIPKVDCLGNQCSSVKAGDIVAQYELLNADVQDDLPNFTHVVVSRFHLNAPRAAGISTPVLTYLTTNLDLDSQRRRLTGRGT